MYTRIMILAITVCLCSEVRRHKQGTSELTFPPTSQSVMRLPPRATDSRSDGQQYRKTERRGQHRSTAVLANFFASIRRAPNAFLGSSIHYSIFTRSTMDTVVDFLTQKWDYGPEVCLAAFALFHSARVSGVKGVDLKTNQTGPQPHA